DGFPRHCLTQINDRKTRATVREASIYSLGRCSSVWTAKGARRDAAAKIFAQIDELAGHTPLSAADEWKEVGRWARALVLFLAGNPWHIADIPILALETMARALRDAVGMLTAADW